MKFGTSFNRAIEDVMARAAVTAILPRFGKLQAEDKHEKAADELVTIADRESEQILADGLALLLPEAKIVGEEAAETDPLIRADLGDELCWIIDPLDGTANFAAGEGPFGILVALAQRGEPIGGWIYDPRSSRFCSASRGLGAFVDGEPIKVSGGAVRAPVAAVSSLLCRTTPGQRLVDAIECNFTVTAMPRCAAWQYPQMVLGGSNISFFGRTLPWDHAAGVLFLAEAGGKATRFDGSPYRVDDDRTGLVAAASEALWTAAMAVIGDAAA
jgi:fructose-1,6-bisphosphatase/inositol monophosphatase family enzyme